jgi:hypothetical protein
LFEKRTIRSAIVTQPVLEFDSRKPRGQDLEAIRCRRSLDGFDAAGSVALQHLLVQFGVGCSVSEMRSIANVIAYCVGFTLSRSVKWTFPGLIQWLMELCRSEFIVANCQPVG